MDQTNHSITLYSTQTKYVHELLIREGVVYSKASYVRQKYRESAKIFQTAYDWFVQYMADYVPKPSDAEYPYWAFTQPHSVDTSGDGVVLTLDVPLDEAVFFDMYDWLKIMRLQYIGETKTEEDIFRRQLTQYGIRHESDILLTNFYPDLKRQIQDSWQRLFRHHEKIKSGDASDVGNVQAGMWQLRRDWLKDRTKTINTTDNSG